MSRPRIPQIKTPISDPDGSPNEIWFRYFQALQNAIPSGTGIPDAPSDGVLYGRRDATWQPIPTDTPVDLGYTPDATSGTVTNSDGTDAVIPQFTTSDAGLVPAPVTTGATRYLREDQTWQVPPSGGVNALPPPSIGHPTYWIQATEQGDCFTDTATNVIAAPSVSVGYVRSRAMSSSTNEQATYGALYQGTSTKRPVYAASVFGSGIGALSFDGVNDDFVFYGRANSVSGDLISGVASAAIPVISSNQFAVIFAGQIRSAGAPGTNFYDEDGVFGDTNGTFGMYVSSPGAGALNLRGGIFDTATRQVTIAWTVNTPLVWTLKYFNGTLKMRVNGGAWSSIAAGRVASSSFGAVLGAGYTAGARWSAIDLGQFVVYETAPFDADLLTVERYLGASIGVTIP